MGSLKEKNRNEKTEHLTSVISLITAILNLVTTIIVLILAFT